MEQPKFSKTEFTFSKEAVIDALRANGYRTFYSDDNWVHENDYNANFSGRTTMQAFYELLKGKNLL